jgi:hypothetical protein
MKSDKKELFIKDAINMMFKIAGHDVTYEDVKQIGGEWYTQWTMTMDQNNEWHNWGVNEIKKRFRYTKYLAEREMGIISLMWGLKISDFKI